jgi:hypothetical protein
MSQRKRSKWVIVKMDKIVRKIRRVSELWGIIRELRNKRTSGL